jgi:hypothetical protein
MKRSLKDIEYNESIVDAVDRLVDPLDSILNVLQKSIRLGVLIMFTLTFLTAAHFHAIWKLNYLESKVSDLVRKAEEVKVVA